MELAFKRLEKEDKELFDSHLKKFPFQESEYTFTNLFSWRHSRNYEYTVYLDYILVRYYQETEDSTSNISRKYTFLTPIGPDPSMVIKMILKQYPDAIFERVGKDVAMQLSKHCKVEEDRAMFDYVYSIQELSTLPGAKYEAKRNFINQALKNSPTLCILDENNVSNFFNLQQKWCDIRNCAADPDLHAEDMAVKEALAHFKEFNLLGVCIQINGKIEAFAIGEKLNDNTFVEHFEKANTEFKGLYQYVLFEFAKLIPKQFEFLNREQDVGIEGLRKAKMSYHPVKMIEKYKISAKNA